jgi:hypothetical protein
VYWVNISKNYIPINSYKIFLNDSNRHGYYFTKYNYYNLWIIHVQSLTNLPKSMWKLVFNVVDVVLKIGLNLKGKPTSPCKAFKDMFLGQINWKTNKNCKS